VDAEGCFLIRVRKNNNLKLGWNVELRFQISLHIRDKTLLEQIQSFFGLGNISKSGREALQYSVQSIKELEEIINHFDKYPLHTQKQADF
jgi:hypothetical protein